MLNFPDHKLGEHFWFFSAEKLTVAEGDVADIAWDDVTEQFVYITKNKVQVPEDCTSESQYKAHEKLSFYLEAVVDAEEQKLYACRQRQKEVKDWLNHHGEVEG